MGAIETLRDALFGNPPSQATEPSREGVLKAFEETLQSINSIVGGIFTEDASAVFATRAALFANLNFPAGTLGVVYADANSDYIGIYVKNGSSGSGSWAFTGLLGRGPGPTDEQVYLAYQEYVDQISAEVGVAQSAAAASQESASFAEEFSGPAYADVAAGEAATTAGQFFRVPIPDTDPVEYTRYQRTSGGSVEAAPLATTAALAASGGAGMVGLPDGTVDDAIKYVTPQMFGDAGTGVANSTAAIQAAIDSGVKDVVFPPGVYVHGNLTCDNDYQRFTGPGAQLVRNANSTTVTVSARGIEFKGIRFSGGSFTGNNITVTGPEAVFDNCDSLDTPGRALYADSDGGNMLVMGGVWNTTDASGTGYDIELHDDTPGASLYSRLIGISTGQATGGVLIDGQGTVRLVGCQIGKLTVASGGGIFEGNRFNGAVSVQRAGNQFSNNAFAGNVTFGDGAGGNIGQIAFDSTNMMQSGTTLTINSDIVESAFHLGQLANVSLVINGPNNDIWHGRIAYTPTLGASGGSPALGNGTLTGGYSRNGRDLTVDVSFVGGSTTNYGTGEFYVTLPFNTGRYAFGSGIVAEDGVRNYVAAALAANANNRVYLQLADTGGDQNAGAAYPFTWGDQDRFRFQITSSYSA